MIIEDFVPQVRCPYKPSGPDCLTNISRAESINVYFLLIVISIALIPFQLMC